MNTDREEELFHRAVNLHREHRLPEAEAAYRQVLFSDPEDTDALHYLGVLCHQTGRSDEGATLIRRAISLDPDDSAPHHNLGGVLSEMGRPREAVAAYERAIELAPKNAVAWSSLALTHKSLGDFGEAERCCRRAVRLDPDCPDAFSTLGNVLDLSGRPEEAIPCYYRAIELAPDDADNYRYLGMALEKVGRTPEAVKLFEDWLERDPGSEMARYLLASHTGEQVPERVPDPCVKEHFDGYATSFDSNLKDLDYQAPALLAVALHAEIGDVRKSLDVLDAGCGTGLAASYLEPLAKRLTGVDLSPRMLDRARGLRLYDELVEAELTSWIEERPGSFDLIVLIDLFIYFGRLERVMAAIASALRPGGRVGFTVEHLEESPVGYRLHPHGRYGHTEDYVRRVVQEAGLSLKTLFAAALRQEAEEAATGLIVVAQR